MNARNQTKLRRIRRAVAIALLGIVTGSGLFYTAPAMAQDAYAAIPSAAAAYVPLDMNALEQLVAPIALYPDNVLNQMLLASTHPDQVVAAAQFVAAGNNPAAVDAQPWDASVKAVAEFPDVLNNLAGNVQFMNQLGAAYVYQGADLNAAIQTLRAEAQNAGNLANCDQYQVVNDAGCIEINPYDPNLIYIPVYDCNVVFVRHDHFRGEHGTPAIRFDRGIRAGAWAHNNINFRERNVAVHNTVVRQTVRNAVPRTTHSVVRSSAPIRHSTVRNVRSVRSVSTSTHSTAGGHSRR